MICEDAINPIPTVQTLKNVRKKIKPELMKSDIY